VPVAGIRLGNNRQSSRTPPQMNDQREFPNGEIAPVKPIPSAKNVLSVVS
jgi:solute carrier family 66 (lysosomal lysine-arginine transporter), member 1